MALGVPILFGWSIADRHALIAVRFGEMLAAAMARNRPSLDFAEWECRGRNGFHR